MLGCQNPVIFRKDESGNFRLIGECYLHGVDDGNALFPGQTLGKSWAVQRFHENTGYYNLFGFTNLETGERSYEDPRLGPLPEGWSRLPERDRTDDDPETFQEFQNQFTGEIMASDPRLTAEALRQRGVKLETFALV